MTPAQRIIIQRHLKDGMSVSGIARKYDGVTESDVRELKQQLASPQSEATRASRLGQRGKRSPSRQSVEEAKALEERIARKMDEAERMERQRIIDANY